MDTVLSEAESLIYGDRAEAYGDPTAMGASIAQGWQVIFNVPRIDPHQISLAMIWMKICRELYHHQRDNLVDIGGYVGVLEKIWKATEEKTHEDS